MAQDQPSLEESPIDRALSQTRGTFDPNAVQVTPDGLMGGHPAQEEEVEDDEVDGGLPPTEPVVPPPAPVAPTPAPVDPAAEQRRLDSERRMHLSMQEADALRADRDRLQREADELRQQIVRPETPAPTRDQPDMSAARAKLSQKLREVSAIDNQLADYWDRLGVGWSEALDPIIEARATEVFRLLLPAQQTAMLHALSQDPEFLNAIKASVVPEVQTQVNANAENTRVYNYVVAEAQKAGFDVGGQGEEADIFWNVAVGWADRSLPQGTTEERTVAALDTMRRLKGVAAPTASTPPVTNNRPPRQPMGRQSAGPTAPSSGTPEPPTPISLDDAITNTHGRNRV